MTYVVKINDVAVPYADQEWSLVSGYVAPIQDWIVPKEVADDLMSSLGTGTDREVTLTLGDPDDPIEVHRVYVVGTAAADNPQRRKLLLADVRFYLGFEIFVVDVNERRRLGERRVQNGDLIQQSLADRVAYKPWTILKDDAFKWGTLRDKALGILGAVKHGRMAIPFVVDSQSVNLEEQIVPEITTDSDGTHGLARTIESLPGSSVYVDLDGVLHVYDARPGAERAMVESLPPTLWRHGHLALVDLSGIRSDTYRMYVDYAIEFRFNYPPVTSGDLKSHLGNLENVLQVTDRSLSIPAGDWGPARTVGEGTWITINEAFAAWGSKTIGPFNLPQLTETIVANHWFGDALRRWTIGGGLTTHDPVWSLRIEELMRRFRTTFRVNKEMWNRVRHWWPNRAAVWDPNTGSRAPSPVYQNFAWTPLDNFVSENIKIFSVNVETSYPEGDGKLTSGSPSGFDLYVDDEELMIFSVVRDEVKFPGHARVSPSPVVAGVTVTGDAGANEAVLQKLVPLGAPLQDANGGWNLSTILSCAPAAPNDRRRLYEVVTFKSELETLVGTTSSLSCKAPDMEQRSHLVEARVAWGDDDTTAGDIQSVFGRADDGDFAGHDPLQFLKPINLETELKPLAKAMAAADLISKLDHYEGRMSVPQSRSLVPKGSISKVTHRVSENRAVTVLEATPLPNRYTAIDFLPASARAYLLKEIQTRR